MNVLDAAFHVVHDYPGGAAALAPRLSKSSTTLCHEVKPPAGSLAKFALRDAVKVSLLANDTRILHAFGEALSHRCVRFAPAPEHERPGDLLKAVSTFAKETGDALLAMHAAIADGRITENEIRAFEKEVADLAPAAVTLVERMRAAATTQSRLRAVAVA